MRFRVVSSLEKCFIDESVLSHKALERASFFRNEGFSFQLIWKRERSSYCARTYSLVVEGDLELEFFTVVSVPVTLPVYPDAFDGDYLRTEPGLYPDALVPLDPAYIPVSDLLGAVWADVKGDPAPGDHRLTFRLVPRDAALETAETSVTLHVIDALLPEQTTKVTDWFHADCLMAYYGCEAFDERHWKLIENFARAAAENGVNTLLTPLFTPPLDTDPGAERPTVQLVDVTRRGGEYTFGFSKLDRWIETLDRVGVKYFEMAHLFTQWGASHCPKVIADTENGVERIFGWESHAAGEEYGAFLKAFIPELLGELDRLGVKERAIFHVSDEPTPKVMEKYRAASDRLVPLLGDLPVIDALSHVELYDAGLIKIPVPINGRIDDFMDRDIKERWVYYCCYPTTEVSNRFISMPSHRNRIMGAMMYKAGVEGFLHWGFNFWFNKQSRRLINPWLVTDGECAWPGGDPFCVYPGHDGSAILSLRLRVFAHALEDIRALKLCESLCGRDFVDSLLDTAVPLSFRSYPRDPDFILSLREKTNSAVEEALSGGGARNRMFTN